VIHPGQPEILYLGVNLVDAFNGLAAGPAAVYRSLNGGNTWEPAPIFVAPAGTSTRDVRLAVTPANPDALYVFSGSSTSLSLNVSSNKGLPGTWSGRSVTGVDPAQFGYNSYIRVDPANANNIYLGTRDLYKSTDDGGTWANLTKNFNYRADTNTYSYSPFSSVSHPDQHALAFDPSDPNIIYIGNDGGLSKSTNGGATFQSQNSSFTLSQFIGITMHPIDPNITYGGTQDNGTQVRLAGGNGGWREFAEGDGGHPVVVLTPSNPNSPATMFSSYIYGTLRRWPLRGDNSLPPADNLRTGNSTFCEPATAARIAFYPPFTSNGVDSTLYFGTSRLFISTDLGSSWTPNCGAAATATDLTKGAPDVLSAIGVERRAGAQVIYTGSAQGRVMVTRDRGANWTDVTAGLPNRFVESLTIDPANAAIAYLTFGGYGTGHVFRTTNFGQSWTDIGGTPGLSTSIPNVPVSAFLIDPVNPTTLYAGSDIGVFRSLDNGATWETFNQGMLPAVVTKFATGANGAIQLSTYGRGAYELTTGASSSCSYSVNPESAPLFPASGGQGSFNIVTGAGCSWKATSRVPWITLTNDSGTGSGTINFNVGINDGLMRAGDILHTDDSFYTIVQAASAAPATVQFSAPSYQSGEGDKRAHITVTRTGSTAGAASVKFATVDDTAAVPCSVVNKTAYARCDYATTVETITFAPGETTKTVTIPLIDDAYVEGDETLPVKLSNAVGVALGGVSTASLIITDNDTVATANPILGNAFFVRQQYLDFLSREAEAGEPWTNILNNCSDVNNNPACDRLTVSASFFGSVEFQLKGFFVYRFYSVSFGRERLPRYTEIVSDMRSVTGATPAEVFQKRAQFAQDWVARTDFQQLYGQMSAEAFVTL
jgi:photosystem II stability/assembly factor-like uncharacterized protein